MIELWTDCWIAPEEVESVVIPVTGKVPVITVQMKSGACHSHTVGPIESARRFAKGIRESIKAATL